MEYWLIHTGEGPGIDGCLSRRTNSSATTINTIDVPLVDKYLAGIEGNLFSLMQEDSSTLIFEIDTSASSEFQMLPANEERKWLK